MFDILIYEPEIPPNTGNIMRLCANTGTRLHLIEPLGFDLDHARLRRAGLDYREWVDVRVHPSLDACLANGLGVALPSTGQRPAIYACSTKGRVTYTRPAYRPGDAFLFGPETRGLPQSVLGRVPPERRLVIPMHPDNRSLNLSNAVAVIVYEAWRQNGFAGASAPDP